MRRTLSLAPLTLVRPALLSLITAAWLLGLFLPSAPAAPLALKDPQQLHYEPLTFRPPHAVRFTLANGIGVYLLEDHELPLVNFHAVCRVGSIDDPIGLEGLAELTGQVMKSGGVEGLSGDDLDERLDSMAALLKQATNRETTSFSLSLLSQDRERGLDLLSRILMKPAFQEEELALSKALKTEELQRIGDDPQRLAFREFGRLMHEGSPRGRLATEASIAAVQRRDLLRFHQRHFRPSQILFAISGDIQRAEAERLMSSAFGNWSSLGDTVRPAPLPSPQEGGVFLIPKEGPQSSVLFGWLAPAQGDPRHLAMELLDFYTGSGGFRSRIVQEIRTNRGLAYSAGSFYQPKTDYGIFGVYAMTKSDATLEVLSLLKQTLRTIATEPVHQEDFAMVQAALLNRFIFSFTSAEQIALQQLLLEYDGLPADDLETYPLRLAAVTADSFNTVAQLIDPAKAVIVVLANEATCRSIETAIPGARRLLPSF